MPKDLQLRGIDLRTRAPRQLAGEYGSSKHAEESFDTGTLSGERLIDKDAGAIRSGMAFDNFAERDATSDAAFKPKCLGIYASVYVYSHMG